MKHATWESIYERLCAATGTASEASLAAAIGISHQAVYDAKKKGSVPTKWIFAVANKYGVSSDWLYYGVGTMRRDERPCLTVPEGGSNEKDLRIKELERQLAEAKEAEMEALKQANAAYQKLVEVLHPESNAVSEPGASGKNAKTRPPKHTNGTNLNHTGGRSE